MTSLTVTLSLLVLLAAPLFAQDEPPSEREANHLAVETSPYLLQHAHNPVDWYPWGSEALERAKAEDKPIFLSVGYSACHWCHVMEHESFEDEAIAALMNEWFVCVKVDREERPDVDALYMSAVQAMTGSGGWPMSVFLTPNLEPFFGGTYFPPRSRGGRPGFEDVLRQIHQLWETNPAAAIEQGRQMIAALSARERSDAAGSAPGAELIPAAIARSMDGADTSYGGFGSAPRFAPKFPRCGQLTLLLRRGVQDEDADVVKHVRLTLDRMARGGMYDQVGGGFARYSVDRAWTVPHFEKMLYDNAQLARLYLEAWQALGDRFYERIAREVLDYVAREMTSPEGGFYSATDADSEGEEGKFFVWSLSELREVCGEDADVAQAWFGASERGNFEGHNILTARSTPAVVAAQVGLEPDEVLAAVSRCKQALYARRAQRVPPLLDDKCLASWNGLMLSAFARAAAVLDEPRYLDVARASGRFLLGPMRREDGGLFRTRRGERSHLDGFLEDYAFVAQGLLDLYEADADPRWLVGAEELAAHIDEHFEDPRGGYFSTAGYGEALPVRLSDAQESSLPSDVGTALFVQARLGLMEGDPERIERARRGLARHGQSLRRWPNAFGAMVLMIDFLEATPDEVYVIGPAAEEPVAAELARWRRQWPPYRVLVQAEAAAVPALAEVLPAVEGKLGVDGRPAVYVCHEGVCEAPRTLE